MHGLTVDRREFLKSLGMTAGAGLVVGVTGGLTGCSSDSGTDRPTRDWTVWLRISPAGQIELFAPRAEMGQGVFTALAMIIAEELDADWSSVVVRAAPLDERFGPQVTENSDSVRTLWMPLRQVGALARHQLVAAAVRRWSVASGECRTSKGSVIHESSDRRLSYGDLAVDAGRLEIPETVQLKPKAEWQFLSRGAKRLDSASALDGSLEFTGDVAVPGMLCASVSHAPWPGGRVAAVDEDSARRIEGVRAIVNLDTAVAVVAEEWWSAENGRKALQVRWTPPASPALDEAPMWQRLAAGCEERGRSLIERGNVDRAFGCAPTVFDAEYEVSTQAHAPMETGVCVADARGGRCRVWVPTQAPWWAYATALEHGVHGAAGLLARASHRLTGRASERVQVYAMPIGGGFGRRLEHDVLREAVLTSRAVGEPVKLLWSREEDLCNDRYRPASRHRLRAVVGDVGTIEAWSHRVAATGPTAAGATFPYACGNLRIEVSSHDAGLPTGPWRSTADAPSAFARECFIDELARAVGSNPLQYRLAMLGEQPRLKRVLEAVAAMSTWSTPPPEGRARGVALHECRGSAVAQVAEVSVNEAGTLRVHRVWCAIDCGLAVNPDGVRAQLEGAIVFGLSAALKARITVSDGRVEQSNFHDFELLRFDECPSIEIEIVSADGDPQGVGEVGVPPIAPAVANAAAVLLGAPVRRLPLRLHD